MGSLRALLAIVCVAAPSGADAIPAASRSAAVETGSLRFTWDSPDDPWTQEELTLLRRAVEDLYPIAVDVYGEPLYRITVNVRKDPDLPFPGSYSPTANEITLRGGSSADALCHEMLHAFRDDDMLAVSSFEEGMVRAAEVEVFDRAEGWTHWDENHSYDYDVWYEALNRPAIAARAGMLQGGYTSMLLRYQLAGVAWAKAFLEDHAFFARFNARLRDQLSRRPELRGSPEDLAAIAASVLPEVEGLPFRCWYARQAVFDDQPPAGWFLYQRVNQFTVDYFRRDASGREKMLPGANLRWEVHDVSGGIVASGALRTGEAGVSILPGWPTSVEGRVTIVASVRTPDGRVTSKAFRTAGGDAGIFGVVTDAADGTVEIRSRDAPQEVFVAPLHKGAFSFPQLAGLRGRFEVVFVAPDGRTSVRRFNKDASRYFLSVSLSDPREECAGTPPGRAGELPLP